MQWLYSSAHSKKKLQPPSPIPRPGVKDAPGRKMMPIEDIKALDPRLRDLSDEEAMKRFKEMTGRG